MSAYKIIFKNKAETQQWEIPYESGVVVWNLDNVHVFTINVNLVYLRDYLATQSNTIKGLFESAFLNVYLYKDGVLTFAGFVSEVNYRQSGSQLTAVVTCKSWLGYFENRYYSGAFSATDAGDIAWGLINAVNDITITKGTVTATKNRDRTYVYDEVAKSVIALSILNLTSGLDFDITNQKVFTAVPRLGADYDNIIFTTNDIIAFDIKVGLVGYVFNKGYIFGGGMGADQIVRDYTLGAPYTTNWFTLEGKTQNANVEDTDLLDDQVEQFVELRKNPVRVTKIRVTTKFLDSYSHGDGITLKIPDLSVNDIFRVKKKTLTFGTDEYVDLEFV